MDDLTSDSPTLPSSLPGVGGALAGRYRLRARLGRGATKEVYLAYDTRLDREVALAIVVGAASDAAARARVTREAQVTGRLGDHPNIITVYDTGEQGGVPYLVLRAMPGGSLAEQLVRDPPSVARTIVLGREIALALAHAHAHGVVHRDVKPDNVWLAADGSAALGDFGIAQQAGSQRLTAEGVVLGTVRYLSPEQIRGADVGPASDLYALGVTLYELVTGRPPFTAKDAASVLTQHLVASPRPPSELVAAVPEGLERLIVELLAKAPEERPASAMQVADALAALQHATAAPRPSAPAAPRPDARRLVSVLAAGADFDDPEALHAVLRRAGEVIERHGGTVERYLGDALVGFFGLTESSGDDALRAARAAVELRASEPRLRLGIEAGELLVGDGPHGATIATGATITTAGRLADAAGRGEIRLGDAMRQAVAADATIDETTGGLLELHLERPALLRVCDTPFVGRERELGELRAAFDAACGERACRLVTVAGAPGIGKSRLAAEFLATLGDEATILAGRCLSYGEGTTYGALADIVRGLGDDPRGLVADLLGPDEQAIRGILAAIGLSDEPAQVEETSWALRRLLERVARDRPLVVAVEDIHWAQPALLDLLDHIAALSSGAPILLVCLTRPELLESRPTWSAPQPNRSVLMLDTLAAEQAVELAERLGAGELAPRIARRAEGNPLFVEQLVAVDAGQDSAELPASIQAVLAARIDRLQPGERTLLQRASVEGRTFHAGALAAPLPERERPAVGPLLVALARKGLIGADRPRIAGEDAFRFTHALIREAAYAGLTKVVRAQLHAGVGQWLERRREAADEIVGYHFEQACLLTSELGGAGDRRLAGRAIPRLEAAAQAARARADPAAASALLERAIALVHAGDAAGDGLLPALGASLFESGRITEATRVLDEAIARSPGDALQARAEVEREFVRLETESGSPTERARLVADAALPVLERAGDDAGQCRAWSLRAHIAWTAGRVGLADEAWCEAAECARRAGDERQLFDILSWRATAAVLGPAPVSEAIRRCTEFREIVGSSPTAAVWMINPLASLHAMSCEFELAERYLAEADETLLALGHLDSIVSHHKALVRLLAGQPEIAEPPLRAGVRELASIDDSATYATTAAMLAQAVYAQGRVEEAGELCVLAAGAAPADDIVTQVIWRGVRAKVLARGGEHERAQALAREAVALVEPTDLLSHRGDAMLDLAEVLLSGGRGDESREAARLALELYESKGNIAASTRGRALLHGGSEGV
jgi:class 3 adenylate cyclase/tetratricopeptide (TPR) repeat protein